jgi:CubicO group peptidase (beta-lactamase class C family)
VAEKQRIDEVGQKTTLRNLLSNRTGLAAATNYLEASKPFKSSFPYSQWHYALVSEIVEKITEKAMGVNIMERLLRPLRMHRTTLASPAGFPMSQSLMRFIMTGLVLDSGNRISPRPAVFPAALVERIP